MVDFGGCHFTETDAIGVALYYRIIFKLAAIKWKCISVGKMVVLNQGASLIG